MGSVDRRCPSRIMKELVLLTGVVCSALLVGCASAPMTSASLDEEGKKFTSEPGRANIYVARPGKFVGGALNVETSLDGRPVGPLAPGTYQLLSVAPGKHQVSTLIVGLFAFGNLTAEADKNYFFQITLSMNWLQPRHDLGLITEKEGRAVITRLKRAETTYRILPAPTPDSIPADLQPTAAETSLRDRILRRIEMIQRGWGTSSAPSLIGVHSLGVPGGPIKEVWFVRQGEGAVRYEVTAFVSPQGGIDFKVDGPLETKNK